MDFDQLAKELDFEKIATSVKGNGVVGDIDFKDAKGLVYTFGDNFAARDFECFDILGSEILIEIVDLPYQTQPIIGYVDVAARVKQDCNIKPFDAYRGQKVIIDWKTRDGELDTRWKNRLVDSWQHRIYAMAYDAKLAIYRGGNREEETREVIIELPETNTEEVREYCGGALAMRKALVQIGAEVWPRVMKSQACEAYGRDCPFWNDCRDYSMPRKVLEDRKMSYTQFENFFLCPEKSRRMLLADYDEETNESLTFGKMVHRGCQELYGQLIQLQQPPKS